MVRAVVARRPGHRADPHSTFSPVNSVEGADWVESGGDRYPHGTRPEGAWCSLATKEPSVIEPLSRPKLGASNMIHTKTV